jgi:VRR-NUC domain.
MAKPPIPTEAQEQTLLFEWAALQTGKYPELALMFHVANGGSRHPVEAANLKRQGVKAGVPDICLPVARGKYHGLYIELKRRKSGRPSSAQIWWLGSLQEQGYVAWICYGWEHAAKMIKEYLETEEK